MRIGIISEGGADIAVIINLLKGITGLDSACFDHLQPQLNFDNTHLQHLQKEQKGGWSLVRQECQERTRIEQFFAFEDNTHIVIHLDSAEAENYGVDRPARDYHAYCDELRERIIRQIQKWMKNHYAEQVLYAIAIEESDAWVLVLFDDKETCSYVNPKRKLSYLLGKIRKDSTSSFKNYFALSKPFANANKVKRNTWLKQNCSLRLFYDDAVALLNQNDKLK